MLSKRQIRDEDTELALRYSILIGGDSAYRQLLLDAPELRVVQSLPESKHWGPGNVSIFRLMHELLVDPNYVLEQRSVLQDFASAYRNLDAGSPTDVHRFLMDLRAVLMFPIRDQTTLTRMASCVRMNEPWDLDAFAANLVPVIVEAIPVQQIADSVQQKWDQGPRSASETLGFLRDSALDLRYAHALLDLDECRRRVRRHPSGFHHTQLSHIIAKSTDTKHTEAWLSRLLGQGHPLLWRLAEGDPFALLKFHDHSVARFVLEDGCLESPVPEVLYFDIERMKAIRAQILGPDEARRVMRVVTTSTDDDGLNARLLEAASALRNLIFICRFQHGDRVAELARAIARRALR